MLSVPGPLPSSVAAQAHFTSVTELRRRQQLRRRRANLWITGGFAGLVITFLVGLIIAVSAITDPSIHPYLNAPGPQDLPPGTAFPFGGDGNRPNTKAVLVASRLPATAEVTAVATSTPTQSPTATVTPTDTPVPNPTATGVASGTAQAVSIPDLTEKAAQDL